MRITNTMIMNNSLLSLNRNMRLLEKYDAQYITGKKIQTPSDDPIIAGKSLRINTRLYEITQYKSNTSDAISWLEQTETSSKGLYSILDRLRTLTEESINEPLTDDDRLKKIVEMKELRSSIIQEANQNVAGRYIFSGFKTDQKVMFDKKENKSFIIEQSFKSTNGSKIQVDEINKIDVYSVKLGYSQIEEDATVRIGGETYSATDPQCKLVFKNQSDPDAYLTPEVENGPPLVKTIHVIRETGEMIFNEAHFESISDPINVTYKKNGFVSGDLNPVHYFDSYEKNEVKGGVLGVVDANNEITLGHTRGILENSIHNLSIGGVSVVANGVVQAPANVIYTDSNTPVIPGPDDVIIEKDTGKIILGSNYNPGDTVSLDSYYEAKRPSENEEIMFEVNLNNKMTINTQARDLFTLDMINDIDMIINTVENRDRSFATKELSKMLTKLDTHMGNELKIRAAIGTKVNRVDLIKNKLDEDGINFRVLKSENEEVDAYEAVTNLNKQELVYKNALSSISKIIQQSLVDFLR